MKKVEYTFCMSQFKPAIAGLGLLVVLVVAWTGWHCSSERGRHAPLLLTAFSQPTAPLIHVKDKMLHPYWGNCSKCHVTTGAGKPISKVMAAAPISVKAKMPHEYWGNCLLCHKVIDGVQPAKNPQARAAAATQLTAQTLGLKITTVTGTLMKKFGLANEDGVLVLEVTPDSLAARAGLMNGDEILRVGKTRVETTRNFDAALNKATPGKDVKLNIYRGNQQRNLFLRIPDSPVLAAATAPMTQNQIETLAEQLGVPKTQQDVARALQRQNQATAAAATAPMTQNQIETLAEQLGVPKTQQDVARALQQQKQAGTAANVNPRKVVVASSGPGIDYPVAERLGTSPYLILFDPALNSYRVAANPNVNDAGDKGVQTGQYAVDMGAGSVIAGSFSQNTLHALQTLKVNVYGSVVGSVRDALSAYMGGMLTTAVSGVPAVRPRQAAATVPGNGTRVRIY